MISLMAVTNRKVAEQIQTRLLDHGISTELHQEDPSQIFACSPTAMLLIHILVKETDLARAREILQARLEGA